MIEEPPPHTIFLLVSIHPDKVISTLRSRTQQSYIPAFTDQELSSMLSKTHPQQLNQAQLARVILLADGNLNKALKLVENSTEDDCNYFKSWMRLCYTHNLTQMVAQAEVFQEMSKTGQRNFLAYALHMLREAYVLYFTRNKITRATEEEEEFIQKLQQHLTHQQIKAWITWLNRAYYCIERHVNARILYLDLSLRIARTFRT